MLYKYMHFLPEYSYFSMFLMGFLASTLLPVGSEWLLIALLIKGLDPFWLLVCATSGNFLGACLTYVVGLYGSDLTMKKIFKIDEKKRARAEAIFDKYGTMSLLFSWLPVIGDPLCLVGGIMRMSFPKYAVLVFIGKLIRYAGTVWAVNHGINYFS